MGPIHAYRLSHDIRAGIGRHEQHLRLSTSRDLQRRLFHRSMGTRLPSRQIRSLQPNDHHTEHVHDDVLHSLAASRSIGRRSINQQQCHRGLDHRILHLHGLRFGLEYQSDTSVCRTTLRYRRVWSLLCDLLHHRLLRNVDRNSDCRRHHLYQQWTFLGHCDLDGPQLCLGARSIHCGQSDGSWLEGKQILLEYEEQDFALVGDWTPYF